MLGPPHKGARARGTDSATLIILATAIVLGGSVGAFADTVSSSMDTSIYLVNEARACGLLALEEVDDSTTYRSNWELSAARAASVGHELLAAGLDPARLIVSGHADSQPRAGTTPRPIAR